MVFHPRLFFSRLPALLVGTFLFFSCAGKEPASFPVRGTNAALLALGREAAAGIIDFSKPEKAEYIFETRPFIPQVSSLEIEYAFSNPVPEEIKSAYQLVLTVSAEAWALPMDLSFLGVEEAGTIHYALPLPDAGAGAFSIALVPLDSSVKKRPWPAQGKAPRFEIKSIEIKERWFGFYREDASGGEAHFYTSPFVFSQGNGDFVLDPPPPRNRGEDLLPEFSAGLPGWGPFDRGPQGRGPSGGGSLTLAAETADGPFEVSSYAGELHIPPGLLPQNQGALTLSADSPGAFRLYYAQLPPFPVPIEADPGIVLDYPQEAWREPRYEVFRWEGFPSLLIFDTADYEVQDRLLKRLAFFTEKAGFRGRLAPDDEIAELHGWNAHDYRAEDLARFFEAARAADFPLLPEERELENILLDSGVIRFAEGRIGAGEGGFISISRESADYLRILFMVHEGFHGLFFIDEDFRQFTRRRWEALDRKAKRFILSYFDFQNYDIKDDYLMVNEFMAHALQQPVSQADRYFGETIPNRMIGVSPWRRNALPEQEEISADGKSSWPELAEAFTIEAEVFSDYVMRRWGLAAGRVRRILVR
jgi:hypothetical protein